jgi:hypothetical protein
VKAPSRRNGRHVEIGNRHLLFTSISISLTCPQSLPTSSAHQRLPQIPPFSPNIYTSTESLVMDGVSSASPVVGIVTLGISVCQGIASYYSDFRNAREDILNLTSSLEQLTSNLTVLKEAITGSRSLDVSNCAVVEKSILSCEEKIGRLNQELIKLRHAPKASGFRAKIVGFTNRALYPFKSDTLQKLTTVVGDTLL